MGPALPHRTVMNHRWSRPRKYGLVRHLARCFKIVAKQIIRCNQAFANVVESFGRVVGWERWWWDRSRPSSVETGLESYCGTRRDSDDASRPCQRARAPLRAPWRERVCQQRNDHSLQLGLGRLQLVFGRHCRQVQLIENLLDSTLHSSTPMSTIDSRSKRRSAFLFFRAVALDAVGLQRTAEAPRAHGCQLAPNTHRHRSSIAIQIGSCQ